MARQKFCEKEYHMYALEEIILLKKKNVAFW